MTSEYYINGITIMQLSTIMNKKICIFYKPVREPSIIGKLCILVSNNTSSLKRYTLLFNNNEFIINFFNRKYIDGILQGNLSDWMNEGYITFI